MKLFCFPYAGGSATVYQKWNKYLAGSVDLCPVELAGRGVRSRIPLYNDFKKMVEDVFINIKPQILEGSYAFYGHSMGARLSFELANRILESGLSGPKFMFMSGCGAPDFEATRRPYHLLPYDEFKEKVAGLGGMPPEILNNDDIFNYYEPIIRSDFKNLETLTFRASYVPLAIDFVLMHGDQDSIPLANVEAWRNYTSRSCRIETFKGGHFFINHHEEQVTEVIKSVLLGYEV